MGRPTGGPSTNKRAAPPFKPHTAKHQLPLNHPIPRLGIVPLPWQGQVQEELEQALVAGVPHLRPDSTREVLQPAGAMPAPGAWVPRRCNGAGRSTEQTPNARGCCQHGPHRICIRKLSGVPPCTGHASSGRRYGAPPILVAASELRPGCTTCAIELARARAHPALPTRELASVCAHPCSIRIAQGSDFSPSRGGGAPARRRCAAGAPAPSVAAV